MKTKLILALLVAFGVAHGQDFWNQANGKLRPKKKITVELDTARITAGNLMIVNNVKNLGAKGDGLTNDSLAFARALAAGGIVYVPAGTYKTNLTIPPNTVIQGDGMTSIIQSNADAALVIVHATNVSISNVAIVGPASTTVYTGSEPAGTKVGIYINDSRYVTLTNVKIIGFDLYGIRTWYSGPLGGDYYGAGLKLEKCLFTNNYIGLFNDEGGEYGSFVNVTCSKNLWGVYNLGGNNKYSNCEFNSNVNGFYLYDTGANGGHSSITGCSFNHNTGDALRVYNLTLGELIVGCNFYGTERVKVDRSDGVQFVANHFGTDSVIVTNTIHRNMFAGNVFDTSYGGYVSFDNLVIKENNWWLEGVSDVARMLRINDWYAISDTARRAQGDLSITGNFGATSGQFGQYVQIGGNGTIDGAVPTEISINGNNTAGGGTAVVFRSRDGGGTYHAATLRTDGSFAIDDGPVRATSAQIDSFIQFGANGTIDASTIPNEISLNGNNATGGGTRAALRSRDGSSVYKTAILGTDGSFTIENGGIRAGSVTAALCDSMQWSAGADTLYLYSNGKHGGIPMH